MDELTARRHPGRLIVERTAPPVPPDCDHPRCAEYGDYDIQHAEGTGSALTNIRTFHVCYAHIRWAHNGGPRDGTS